MRENVPPPSGADGPGHAGAPAPRHYGGGPRPGPRGSGGPPGARPTRRPRRKVCAFCVDKVKRIDYKDVARVRRYLSDRARIEPRRKTGSCAKHQRMLTTALKRARHMALLPFTAEHVRDMMSPQARALAGGPPPERPARFEGPRLEPPRPAPHPETPPPPAATP